MSEILYLTISVVLKFQEFYSDDLSIDKTNISPSPIATATKVMKLILLSNVRAVFVGAMSNIMPSL
jgi:hypothetical protein